MPGRIVRRHRRGFLPTPALSAIRSKNLETVITSTVSTSLPVISQTDGTTSSNGLGSTSTTTPTQTVITLSDSTGGSDPSTTPTISATRGSISSGVGSSTGGSTVTFRDTFSSTRPKITVNIVTEGIISSTTAGHFPTSVLSDKNASPSGMYTVDSTLGSLSTSTPTTPAGGDGLDNTSSSNSRRTRLSSGAIAAIAAALALVFFAFALFLCRRWSRTRREQAIRWIFQRASRHYEGSTRPLPRSPLRSPTIPPRRSRSHSIFSPTRMTEMQRLGNVTSSRVMESSSSHGRRLSNASDGSIDSQYPLSRVRGSIYNDNAPMSVRPFSPSETFEFPQPPFSPREDDSDSPSLSSHITHSVDKSARASFRMSQVIPPIPPLPSSPPPVPNIPTINPCDGNTPFNEPSG